MDDRSAVFKKQTNAVAAAAKAIDAWRKAAAKTPADPLAVREAATKVAETLAKIPGIESEARALAAEAKASADAAGRVLDRERAVLAGKVVAALRQAGIPVDGNLPTLRAGVFSLEFSFLAKGACTIWFGPKKERLASCPLDPEAIASKVVELDRALLADDPAGGDFLADLDRAYRVAAFRKGVADGERVPLPLVMAELAFARQDATFLADPRREHFETFGRVEFAARLSRQRERRHADRELRLDVATMAQTRKPEDHLWVPTGRTGDGTNFATLRFVRVRETDSRERGA